MITKLYNYKTIMLVGKDNKYITFSSKHGDKEIRSFKILHCVQISALKI